MQLPSILPSQTCSQKKACNLLLQDGLSARSPASSSWTALERQKLQASANRGRLTIP